MEFTQNLGQPQTKGFFLFVEVHFIETYFNKIILRNIITKSIILSTVPQQAVVQACACSAHGDGQCLP